MELVFEEQTIEYLRRTLCKSTSQELTQELIVPDSYPDCARVVFTGGSCVMRGKECRDGSVIVTGGVRAGLLYVPEDGAEARGLECYLPFAIREDDPAATAQMYLMASCRVKSADARLINSRKILVRVDLVCELTGYENASQTVKTLKDAPAYLQTKQESYRCTLPREYAEKPFSMTEDLDLTGQEAAMQTIVQYWLSPIVTDKKLMGNKAVCKGMLFLKVLYLASDGTPETCVRQIPFSQYCELRGDYADDEWIAAVEITGNELELSKIEDADAKLLLSVSLLLQCTAMQTTQLTLTSDAYTTRGTFEPEWSEVSLPCVLDMAKTSGTLRGSVPKQARAVLDSTLYLDAAAAQKEDGGVKFTVPASVNILYLDEEGQLQSAIVRDQVTASVPAGSCASCTAAVSGSQEGFAAPSGGGIDVRYDVDLSVCCRCDEALRTLSGGTLTDTGSAPEQFCVVVKTNSKTQSLWDLAKAYRTSEAAIAQANGITTGEAEQGELLLIPM